MVQPDPVRRPWRAYAGRHGRVFAKDSEAALAAFVRDNRIATGLIFADSDFWEIAMNAFLLKYQDSTAEMPMFQCHAGFIANFKRNHCLTSGRVHFKGSSPNTENQRQTWLPTIGELLQNVPWDRIINCDKTSSFLHSNGILTRAEVGAESVQTTITGNEKGNIAVVACGTAAGDKLPLPFIATGKTIRVETTQIGSVKEEW
jgi:hypothetical protein